MSLILNIETATTVCSVALSDNETILAFKELNKGYTHAENLHIFIGDVIKEAGSDLSKLSAIAVSKGPGSYTGLRIGVSAAKGLAYALNIPLISVDTLQVITNSALNQSKFLSNSTALQAAFCPMIDARRMEVYTAVYDQNLNTLQDVNALIVDETSIQQFSAYSAIYFFGDGMPKCKDLLQKLPNAKFIEGIFPSAKFMCKLSHKKFTENKFEDTAYFEPYYLKEFFLAKNN